MKIAIYPGTFDPITFGHIDVIKKSLKLVDTVIPKIGPHKGVKHTIIHDFGDGTYNVKPNDLSARQIRYRMGAAKAKGTDKIAFLRYPYTNDEAIQAFESIGVNVDMSEFALRERKKKYSPRSKDVKSILALYENFDFKE